MKEQIELMLQVWNVAILSEVIDDREKSPTAADVTDEIVQVFHASPLAWQVSVDTLAKLKVCYQDILSPTPVELRPWGFRAGYETALYMLGLLEAVTKPESTAVVDSSD